MPLDIRLQYFITGASGFVGRHLLGTLNAPATRLVAISRRLQEKTQAGVTWRPRSDALRSEVPAQVETTVLHLEVKQHVANPTPRDIAEFQSTNLGGTQEWLDWCAKNGIHRFVHFSTIKAVQAGSKGVNAVGEEAIRSVDTPYGQSKWEAEMAVRAWTKMDSRRSALILRPAVIYGPGNTANMYSFVDALYRGRFFLVGRNANVKSLVSIQNLCQAVAFLLPRMRPGLEIYNITDEKSYSVRELADRIARLLNVRWRGRSIPLPLARVSAAIGTMVNSITHKDVPLSRQRLEALLETTHFSCVKLLHAGFKHPETTDEGLANMVTWYKALTDSDYKDCSFGNSSSGKGVTGA